MKKLLLTFSLAAIGLWSYAQVQVKGISPASVQHTFDFGVQAAEGGWPGETDDGTWAMTLDFNQPGVYVQGELMMVQDTATGINPQGFPKNQEGCFPLVNSLAGKIAVVRRNTCNFSKKILEAQNAGAIAVVIINREDALIGMLAGPDGVNCTIPAIAIKSSAGAELVNEMANGPVVLFIGNKIGVFSNDMATAKPDFLMPASLTTPWDLAQNSTEFPVDFGLYAYNMGSNAQNGVTASVDVTYGGTSVYSNTAAPLNFVAPAGIVLDTQYFDLGSFSGNWNVGTYSVTYTINGADGDMSDNVFSYDFTFTNNDDVFGYGPATAAVGTVLPVTTNWVSPDLSTTFSWEPCIVFRNANAGSKGTSAMGMNVSAKAVGSTMANADFAVRAYSWTETYTDLTAGVPTYSPRTQIGAGSYFFVDESESGVNLFIPFDEAPIALSDNQRYMFCIYSENDSLRFGYNSSVDYTTTVYDKFLQPIYPLADIATSGATPTWYTPGFGLDYCPAVNVVFDISSTVGIDNANANSTLAPYPNPASNLLLVPVRKGVAGNVTVDIYDLAGKLVISEKQTIGNEPLRVNVASIANGAYVFNLTFADGSTDTFKVSVNR